MDVIALLRAFCDAVERRDGAGFASLFSEDGVYHDAFYGAFVGRAKIAELIDDWFYRTAYDFRWDMHKPVTDGYARYAFSYLSTLPEAQGRRVGFEGVSIIKLRAGLIVEYREVANVGPALVALGFSPERVCKILAREVAHDRGWSLVERLSLCIAEVVALKTVRQAENGLAAIVMKAVDATRPEWKLE